MLILKIMCAVRGNDEHPRQGYHLIAGVTDVEFFEGTELTPPSVHFTRAHGDEESVITPLVGNVYVMNEAGRTISRFEVLSPEQDAALAEIHRVGRKNSAELEASGIFHRTGPAQLVVKEMVERFLRWRLPEDFSPDCGISFSPGPGSPTWPVGTNLLSYSQAEAMVRHMISASET